MVAIDESMIQNESMRLERIDGVASVEVRRFVEKEVLIELDRDRTSAASDCNIYQLAQYLGDDNFTMATGTVVDSSKNSDQLVLEDLQSRLVERSIRLGDIATISYDQPSGISACGDEQPAVAVVVLKEGDANIREICGQVAEEMSKNPAPSVAGEITLFNQCEVIDEA